MTKVLVVLLRAGCCALAITSACSSSSGGAAASTDTDGGGGNTGDGGITTGDDGGSNLQPVTTLATGQKNPGGIASNGTNISWTTCDTNGTFQCTPGSIMTMPAAGGTPVTLGTKGDNGALLAMDGTNVYWFGPDDDTVDKISLTGGSAVMLAKGLANSPLSIAIDTANVYWVNGVGIEEVPLDGGARKNLGGALTLEDVYGQPSVAVNASSVFALTATGILSVALTGGTATSIVTGQNPNAIAADATNVYWANSKPNAPPTIMKATATGGSPVTLATLTSPAVPFALAVDATSVYWIEALGDVKKVPIAGGTPVSLAHAPTLPGGIAVDATSVYWTDTAAGTVLKTAK